MYGLWKRTVQTMKGLNIEGIFKGQLTLLKEYLYILVFRTTNRVYLAKLVDDKVKKIKKTCLCNIQYIDD